MVTKRLECLGISSADDVPVRNKKGLSIPFVEKTGPRRELRIMIEKPKLGRDLGSSVNVCTHVAFLRKFVPAWAHPTHVPRRATPCGPRQAAHHGAAPTRWAA